MNVVFFRVCVPLVTILLLPFKTPYTLSAFFKALHPKITYGIMTLMCLHICNTLDLIACEQYFDFPTSFAFNLLPLPDLSHGFKPHPHYFFLVLFPAAPQKIDILTQLFFLNNNLFPLFFSYQNPTSYHKAQNCRVYPLKPCYAVQ